jgi:hypothetical protein
VTSRRVDLIDVVEAAYAPQPDTRAWLHALVEAARPLIPDTEGCFALHAKLVEQGKVELCDFALPNDEQRFRDVVVGATPQLSGEDLARTYYSPLPFATISQRMGGARAFAAHWVSQGLPEGRVGRLRVLSRLRPGRQSRVPGVGSSRDAPCHTP